MTTGHDGPPGSDPDRWAEAERRVRASAAPSTGRTVERAVVMALFILALLIAGAALILNMSARTLDVTALVGQSSITLVSVTTLFTLARSARSSFRLSTVLQPLEPAERSAVSAQLLGARSGDPRAAPIVALLARRSRWVLTTSFVGIVVFWIWLAAMAIGAVRTLTTATDQQSEPLLQVNGRTVLNASAFTVPMTILLVGLFMVMIGMLVGCLVLGVYRLRVTRRLELGLP